MMKWIKNNAQAIWVGVGLGLLCDTFVMDWEFWVFVVVNAFLGAVREWEAK